MLRGEKKKRSPKMWAQKQNQLRKLRDRERDSETKRLEKEKSTAIEEYNIEKHGDW